MKTNEIKSIGIRKFFHPSTLVRVIASAGEGDMKVTLWQSYQGKEAIETNGDPVFPGDIGFDEARAAIIAANS